MIIVVKKNKMNTKKRLLIISLVFSVLVGAFAASDHFTTKSGVSGVTGSLGTKISNSNFPLFSQGR